MPTKPVHSALNVNTMPVNSNVRRRPTISAMRPANSAPMAQPIRIDATAKPVAAEPDLNVAWMPGTAPLITALS